MPSPPMSGAPVGDDQTDQNVVPQTQPGTGLKPGLHIGYEMYATGLNSPPNLGSLQSKIAGGVHELVRGSGQSLVGRGFIIALILFFVSLFAGIFILNTCNGCTPTTGQVHTAVQYYAADLILFGAIFLYVGFTEFSKEQTLMATPVAKIDAAAYGLNEITGRFIPEGVNKPIVTPLSRARAPYYLTLVYTLIRVGSGKSSHIEVMPLGRREYGVPILMTDGTGYIAPDMANVDIGVMHNSYVVLKNGKPLQYPHGIFGEKQEAQDFEAFKQFISDQFGGSASPDLTAQQQFEFRPLWKMKPALINSRSPAVKPEGQLLTIYMAEMYIPMDQDYFGMGSVSTSEKLIDGKPVKLMGIDPHTKILQVDLKSKRQEFGKLKQATVAMFGVGIVILMVGIFIASNAF